jgi:hypothetical protein
VVSKHLEDPDSMLGSPKSDNARRMSVIFVIKK